MQNKKLVLQRFTPVTHSYETGTHEHNRRILAVKDVFYEQVMCHMHVVAKSKIEGITNDILPINPQAAIAASRTLGKRFF
jgi:hypothetical protein